MKLQLLALLVSGLALGSNAGSAQGGDTNDIQVRFPGARLGANERVVSIE